jgi:hypothetical protein
MDPDQRSLIRIHAVRLQTLLQVQKLLANSMDPYQTARMRRVVWIHAGSKRTWFCRDAAQIVLFFEFIIDKFDNTSEKNATIGYRFSTCECGFHFYHWKCSMTVSVNEFHGFRACCWVVLGAAFIEYSASLLIFVIILYRTIVY